MRVHNRIIRERIFIIAQQPTSDLVPDRLRLKITVWSAIFIFESKQSNQRHILRLQSTALVYISVHDNQEGFSYPKNLNIYPKHIILELDLKKKYHTVRSIVQRDNK